VTSPSDAPPPSGPGATEPGPLPLPLELPGERRPVAPTRDDEPPRGALSFDRKRVVRWVVRGVVALVLLAASAGVVVFWVLPWYVRREVIAEAAAHGIVLEVDDAAIGTGGFRLLGVHASSAAVPNASATAPEIDVETSGLHPDKMTVRRAELTVQGRFDAVDAELAKWRSSPSGGQGGTWMPSALVVDESRVVWQSPTGEGARLDAANVHFEVTWRAPAGSGATSDIHARSDKVTLAVPGGTLGPWRVDLDRTPGSSRVRVALDPAVPDTSTILVVGNDERTTSVDVVVPRSPPARLGVAPEMLGLHGSSLQVAVDAHYASQSPKRADLTSKGGLYSIEAGLPHPLDVTWEASATGDPGGGLDLKKSRLAAGPLVGSITGTLKTFDDGFRVDVAWKADAVPCAAFEAPAPAGGAEGLDIASQLRKLAEATGITKVKGDVSARGSLSFDSRDLSTAKAEFTPDVRCTISLFGN